MFLQALGNFYFVHDCLDKAEIWNFKELKFEPVNEREVFSGNIEFVPTKEKAKFPQNYFPEVISFLSPLIIYIVRK